MKNWDLSPEPRDLGHLTLETATSVPSTIALGELKAGLPIKPSADPQADGNFTGDLSMTPQLSVSETLNSMNYEILQLFWGSLLEAIDESRFADEEQFSLS